MIPLEKIAKRDFSDELVSLAFKEAKVGKLPSKQRESVLRDCMEAVKLAVLQETQRLVEEAVAQKQTEVQLAVQTLLSNGVLVVDPQKMKEFLDTEKRKASSN